MSDPLSGNTLSWPVRPTLPCAWGDVFDRLTILDLKRERFTDSARRAYVEEERAAVMEVIGDLGRFPSDLAPLLAELAAINGDLWNTETAIRACEAENRFDAGFVALARRVYTRNADRARVKNDISLLLGSALVEQKDYGAGR